MTELLLGCGSNRTKKLFWQNRPEWSELVTLDHNPAHKPDIVHDLENLPLPFDDDSADECHLYCALEHTGRQGDWKFFFAQWSDFWRILKPNGTLFAICPHPTSPWAWGDPSHSRIISPECLTFLSQPNYTAHVGSSPMSDFRHVYQADFDLVQLQHQTKTGQFEFVLRAVKPSRIA